MTTKKLWAGLALVKTMGIETPFGEQTIELAWTNGQVGAIPVFSSKKRAEDYMDGGEVFEVQIVTAGGE